jgi:N-acetylglutamate synthase-like GNAT family acetyltransferase
MTEIRPIREFEAEKFLQLICDTFGLDFDRAYDLFFQEPLFDLNRKWALIEGQQLISVLTTTPLEFGWGKAIGIAGVATRKDRQNEGHARRLIDRVLRDSDRAGESAALLFAADTRLYEACGFEGLDRVVRGPVVSLPLEVDKETMSFEALKAKYNDWAAANPNRLRRDDKRWEYWKWNFREPYKHKDGYFTVENETIREMLVTPPEKRLPVARGTEWVGLSYVTDQLEVPLGAISVPMYLMGRNVPGQPEMFLTDQF